MICDHKPFAKLPEMNYFLNRVLSISNFIPYKFFFQNIFTYDCYRNEIAEPHLSIKCEWLTTTHSGPGLWAKSHLDILGVVMIVQNWHIFNFSLLKISSLKLKIPITLFYPVHKEVTIFNLTVINELFGYKIFAWNYCATCTYPLIGEKKAEIQMKLAYLF